MAGQQSAEPDRDNAAMHPVDRRERIRSLLAGEAVRPVPHAFWRHFPADDRDPATFAAATAAFYRRYGVDLIKLMPTGMYSVVDYGVEIRPSEDELGTTLYASGPVHGPADWARLPTASPERGMLAEQVDVVRRVRSEVGPDVPIVQTVFSPLTMAWKIAGGDLGTTVLADETAASVALGRLADDVIAFGRACVDAGADGFFFATQMANADGPGRDAYERLGVPYDLRILDALRASTTLQILHLHGPRPYFDLADRYPVDVVNWEDRETPPGLSEALSLTSRCLLGGVDRHGLPVGGSPAEIAAQVRDAIDQTGGGRLIVGAGCVLPISARPENLEAIGLAAGGA